ncbi:hypothetical protein C7I84_00625 [Mesorhizobium ephedrae]|uniref:Uncharacterized protein n=1 Tax=Kumtagia ephedrae TaxID=2116701 RepID=A0A2P7ST65_9HYPH|nr:hypothetical protein C7I84_00625 [Mesorhizobium ephedrae]
MPDGRGGVKSRLARRGGRGSSTAAATPPGRCAATLPSRGRESRALHPRHALLCSLAIEGKCGKRGAGPSLSN